MRPEQSLVSTQRWLQRTIMSIDPLDSATGKVRPSQTLAPPERVAIYRSMYGLRLREALEADYPLLSGYLGEELWQELTELYLDQHPSSSYTLNRLGDHLPQFLLDVEGLPEAEFVADLARYELARTLTFDADETPSLTAGQIQSIRPEKWEQLRLQPVDALRLESFGYPVHEFETGRDTPGRATTRLAIFRRDFAVLAMELVPSAFVLFTALVEGNNLGAAIRLADPPEADLSEWFRSWVSEGMFRSIPADG